MRLLIYISISIFQNVYTYKYGSIVRLPKSKAWSHNPRSMAASNALSSTRNVYMLYGLVTGSCLTRHVLQIFIMFSTSITMRHWINTIYLSAEDSAKNGSLSARMDLHKMCSIYDDNVYLRLNLAHIKS